MVESTETTDPSPVAERGLNFSIENILRPEFGRSRRYDSDDSTTTHSNDNLNDEFRKDDPKEKDETVWPAWVYCTRYSDRPSS
ncbi:unnamed protein product, partial [Nesidiocoris tenuis]